jgi:hypothetical protein
MKQIKREEIKELIADIAMGVVVVVVSVVAVLLLMAVFPD